MNLVSGGIARRGSIDASARLSPPLKWAGGKRWQVPHLMPFWEPHRHRRMVEPFCGGLAVTLGLGPSQALLNDVNPHLINFYRWLKRGLTVDLDLRNDRELFYRHRVRFNELLRTKRSTSREAACLFYFLNRTGFNGLCRFNSSGQFNVPFGRYENPTICDEPNLRAVSAALQGVRIERRHYLSVMRRVRPGDFVYFDPPYHPRSRTASFTAFDRYGFTTDDQCTLRNAFAELSRRGAYVMLTNSDTPLIRALYAGFKLDRVFGRRLINSKGGERGKVSDLIVRNYD